MHHEQFLPGDAFCVHGDAMVSTRIQDVCNSWSNHNAPVFRHPTLGMAVLQIEPPSAHAVQLWAYLKGMERAGQRWVQLRPTYVHDAGAAADDVREWYNAVNAKCLEMVGMPYPRREIARILARSLIDGLPLPDSWARWLKPRKGVRYCTRGTLAAQYLPPLLEKAAPGNLVNKSFVNPGDVERTLLLGTVWTKVGASDATAYADMQQVFSDG